MASRPEKLKLKFSLQVAAMQAKADVFLINCTADQAALAAVDPDIDSAWLGNFSDAIDAARAAKTPLEMRGEVMVFTEDVEAKMIAARDKFQELMFYVKKAFPGSKGKTDTYGQPLYEKARNSADKMEKLLHSAYDHVVADNAELVAVGYTSPKASAFATTLNDLMNANAAQDSQKSGKPEVSEDYYAAQNAVWDFMSQAHNAAVFAFKDDYGSYVKYLLYDPDNTDLAFTLTLPDTNAVYHHFINPIDPGQKLIFSMLSGNSDCALGFSLTDGGSAVGTPHNLPQGGSVTFFYSDFGAMGEFLRVVQTGITEMKVRVILPGV